MGRDFAFLLSGASRETEPIATISRRPEPEACT
jgi:hypothetical protein